MTLPYNTKRPYRYNVLNHEDEWEPWSGAFQSKMTALLWYGRHGHHHESRGHVIALFKNQVKLKT